MADLFFKVNADYQELIRMQQEASKLKQALSDFSGTQREFESLVDSLNKLEEKMQSCTQAISDGFTKINNGGLQEFDKSVLDLCENMEVYFGVTISEIDQMLSSLHDAILRLGDVQLAGADDFDLLPARQQIASLTEELITQRSELERQKEEYRGLSSSIRESFGQPITLTGVEVPATSATPNIDTSSVQGAQTSYEGIREVAVEAAEVATEATEQVTEATEALNDALERRVELTQESVPADATESITSQVEAERELTEVITEAQAASDGYATATITAHDELINGIVETRNEIVNTSGVFSQSFGDMLEKAGGMSGVIDSVKKSLNLLPTNQLEKLKSLFAGNKEEAQGAAGVVSQLTGENDKLASAKSALAKVQEVVNALEIAYEVVQRSSLAMLLVEDVKTWALSAAKSALGVATEGATAAQWSFNAAVAANPIGAFIELLVIAAGAVWAFCEALFGSDDELEEVNAEIEETGQLISDLNDAIVKKTIANTAKATEEFENLQKSYNALGNDLKKKEAFIHDNAKALDKLGLNVMGVKDADDIFVRNTPQVIEALRIQAEYAAITAVKMDILRRQQEALAGVFDSKIKLYGKVSGAEAKAAGINTNADDDEDIVLTTMDEVNKVNRERQSYVLGEINKSLAYLEKQEKAVVEQAKVVSQFGNKYIDPENLAGGLKPKTSNAERAKAQDKGGKGGKGGKEDKYDATAAANKRADLLKKYADLVTKTTEKLEDDITKADIDFMEKGTDKQVAAIRNNTQLQLKALNGEKKKLIESYRKMLLESYLTEKGAKKDDERYSKINNKSDEELWENISTKYDEDGNAVGQTDIAIKLEERRQQILKAGLIKEFEIIRKAQEDALKSYEKYYDKQVAIQRKYHETRTKLEEQHSKGEINDEAYKIVKDRIDRQEQAEMNKVGLDQFKSSPLYQMAMSGEIVDSEALQMVYDEMSKQMDEAAATMQPADFKAFMDAFNNISNQMIERNPFGALKDAIKEVEDAELELIWAHKDTLGTYQDYGIDQFGKEQEGGRMWQLREDEKAALQELTDAENAYNDARANGNADELAEAQIRLTSAKQNEANASNALTSALNKVNAAETKEANAIKKVESAKVKEKKATKETIDVTKQLASAIKNAADMFDSPIARAVSGMMDLTTTTLNSIQAIKDSDYAAAEGVAKVAAAVQNAVAILAIIQAAWQVINTIMSLFSGKDEEEYKNRINSLKAQVDALDYAFNNLKEDMDEAWGTEAIDAYIKAVETLNDRQKAQLELIKEQSKAHIGHHSLEHYMKKEAGITDKELAAAKKRIEELGGDTSTGWITDWIYTLTADQLKQFLTEGIGVTITGKLGGVSGTGDYSGSDWLNDLQEFANSAQTVEDMADEMAAKLNGISLDGLKDEIKSLVTTFDTSFNDINNSFDQFMREAAYNKARSKYDKDLEQFYNDLKDINNLYTEGEISEEEYKKRIAELRERYKSLVKGAQDDYQQSLTEAGINVKDIEQGATTGGFDAMSEDTGTELNGRFAAMQAQETITAENTGKLLEITGNIHDIADEIRDLQVSSYLELREINENTKKVVEPILAMQEDIKRIKENTDSL